MKQIYDYFVARYGNKNNENLYQMIANLQRQVENLETRIDSILDDLEKLREENLETTNVLYELQNDISAVDQRIDILANEDSLKVEEREDGSLDISWNPNDPKYSFLNELTEAEQQKFFINAIKEAVNNVG